VKGSTAHTLTLHDNKSHIGDPKVKVYIETLGCALNKGDSILMANLLRRSGFELVNNYSEADVVIVNTCIVRKESEEKSAKAIRKYVSLGKKVVVAGCMAGALPAHVLRGSNNVVLVPPDSITAIVDAIKAIPGSIVKSDKYVKFDLLDEVIIDGPTAIIPIAEGCLDNCSFCIVKLARPHLKSMKPEKVVSIIRALVKQGVKEIELTAQDLAVYGYDIAGKYLLPDLLEEILSIEGDYRIRLGQLNPRHLYNYIDRIVDLLKDPRIYKHLHIPLQSASNKVLEVMNRQHDVELFREVLQQVKSRIEGVQIATDVIVGHPGEGEEEFLETVKFLVNELVDRVHIARYSPRPLTRAAGLPQIPDEVKKVRSRIAEEVYELIGLNVHLDYVGAKAHVIITEVGLRQNTCVGRLFNYKPVVLGCPDTAKYLGREAVVRITDATYYDLRGEILELI